MRLRVVQKDVNTTDLSGYLADAATSAVDIVCFGELAATGCLYVPRPVPDLESLVASWRNLPLGVMCGVARPDGNILRNSYVYVHGSRTQIYDKINLFPPFSEDRVYSPGTEPGLFDTPLGRIGVAICYDIRFDNIFASLRDAAVRCILIPAAFPLERIDQWRTLITRRAAETGTTVIGINAVGADSINRFGGSSMVAAPDGTIIAQADETSETVLDFEL